MLLVEHDELVMQELQIEVVLVMLVESLLVEVEVLKWKTLQVEL